MRGQTDLRERKKAQTRLTLSMAAMRLAVERGAQAVTEDEIAATANVSLRTFHNYFSGKEEAIAEAFRAMFQVYTDALRDRPLSEPIWDALEYVCVQIAGEDFAEPQDAVALLRAVATNPGNTAAYRIAFEEIDRLFVGEVARRTGTNVETDLRPYLLASAAGAALKAALTSVRARAAPDPAGAVREAFAMLRVGLGEPPK